MKKVLIFGIGGFVGHYLADEFHNAGYDVYGSDISKPHNMQDYVVYDSANLMDSKNIDLLVSKINPDIIINLAAVSSVGQSWGMPQTTIMVNVVGALNILESARKCMSTPKVMFIGSSEEYIATNNIIDETVRLDATNPYGISKVTQESFAKLYRDKFGMKVYCVRPFNHTGIGQKDSFVLPSFCKQVADIEKSSNSGVIKVGNLLVERDFSHVKDIVHAYRLIVESNNYNTIYNVGSGKAYSIKEMLNYIIGLSSKEIAVEVDPSRFRPSDQPCICCNHDLITNELGWIPQFTVFDALKEMYNYFLLNEE